MSVDFEIMQDIPAEKRGLHHWATPVWLSIAKNPDIRKATKDAGGAPSKKVFIKDAAGVITEFKSMSHCARAAGVKPPTMSDRVKRAKKRDDRRIKFNGEYYTLV